MTTPQTEAQPFINRIRQTWTKYQKNVLPLALTQALIGIMIALNGYFGGELFLFVTTTHKNKILMTLFAFGFTASLIAFSLINTPWTHRRGHTSKLIQFAWWILTPWPHWASAFLGSMVYILFPSLCVLLILGDNIPTTTWVIFSILFIIHLLLYHLGVTIEHRGIFPGINRLCSPS